MSAGERVRHLAHGHLADAPPPCRACMWWQTRPGRQPGDRLRWAHETEDDFGAWGKLYLDEGRVIGLIQYGPADRFPRTQTMPAGPPSRDAVVVTCAFLTDVQSPWVLQSLFLAAIGECRDRGHPGLEAFSYRYVDSEPFAGRFLTHRTIFPSDFLRDFGFHPLRSAGRIELMRLDLRALELEPERSLAARLRARLAPVNPAPVPLR